VWSLWDGVGRGVVLWVGWAMGMGGSGCDEIKTGGKHHAKGQARVGEGSVQNGKGRREQK